MKKKLILTVAALLCLSILLSSCGLFGNKSGLEKVYNTDWTDPDDVSDKYLGNMTKLNYDGGDIYDYNDNYILVKKTDDEGAAVYKIYNVNNPNKAVATFADSISNSGKNNMSATKYYVELIDDCYAILTVDCSGSSTASYTVVSTPFGDIIRSEELNISYDLDFYTDRTVVNSVPTDTLEEWIEYDSFTEEYSEYVEREISGTMITEDLMIKGDALYRVDDNGNETFIRNIGLSTTPESGWLDETEKYYIADNDSSYVYYDKQLNYVTTVSIPEYYNGECKSFIMENGNILVQVVKRVGDNAWFYDFMAEDGGKYTCETYMINPENGKQTDLDYDFIIEYMVHTYVADEKYDYWAEDLENVAIVYPIVDKSVVTDDISREYRSITNKGKDKGSLEFMDDLAYFPSPRGDGYFTTTDIAGNRVVLDKDSKVVARYSMENAEFEADYVIKNGVIYDFLGNKVFDKNEANVDKVEIVAKNAFYTSKSGKDSVTYTIYFGGKEVQRFVVDNSNSQYKNGIDEFSVSLSANAYCVRRYNKGGTYGTEFTFEYYNLKGELIGTFDYMVMIRYYADDYMIVRGNDSLNVNSEYYMISFK